MTDFYASFRALQDAIDAAKKLKKAITSKKGKAQCDKVIENYEQIRTILLARVPANDEEAKPS